jgi:hypothetical protein
MVLGHSTNSPSDSEWDTVLEFYASNSKRIQNIVVVTGGGGPNARQRSAFNQSRTKLDWNPKTVILSGSAMVRGIVTAFNWWTSDPMKMFPLENLSEALIHLKLSSAEQTNVTIQVKQFRLELKI